jgi:hypothetical protein
MSNAKQTPNPANTGPKNIDVARLALLKEPLQVVQFVRQGRDGQNKALNEVVPALIDPNTGLLRVWTVAAAVAFASGEMPELLGGGNFHVTFVDSSGTSVSGDIFFPGPHRQYGGVPVGPQQQPFNHAYPPPPGYTPPFGAAPPPPPAPEVPWWQRIGYQQAQQQQQQHQAQQQYQQPYYYNGQPQQPWYYPNGQPCGPGTPGAAPSPNMGGFGQQPPYGNGFQPSPPMGNWGQQPFYTQPQLAAPGDSKAELLEKQIAALREDAIRRQANEGLDRLLNLVTQNKADTDTKFNQMLEQLRQAQAGPRNGESESNFKLELAKLEQRHQQETAALAAQQREAEFRRELAQISANAKAESDKIQQQLASADKALGQSATQSMFDRMTAIQKETQDAQRRVFEEALKREPGMLEMMKLFKQLQGDDPFASKIKDYALDQLFNGPANSGAPSTAAMIAQLGGTALERVTGVLGSYFEHKTAEERSKAQKELAARKKAEELRRRQMGGGVPQAQVPANGATPAAGLNGAANGANGAAHPAAPLPPLPDDDDDNEPVADGRTAEDLLADDERPYFGDSYSQIKALRLAVAGGLMKPEQVVSAVVDAFMYFQGFSVNLPVVHDIMHDPRRAIDKSLPDASGAYRAEILRMLPPALKEALDDLKEQAEEEQEGDTK